MNVSDKIAEWLDEKCIKDCFGVIGSGNMSIWNSIAKREKTRIHCFHHEQAAVQAAMFYYSTSRNHAVCLVTTGAGSSNAITGVLSAWMDSIPLLIIAGNEPTRFLESPVRVKGAQGFDSDLSVRGCMTKGTICLLPDEGADFSDHFDEAFYLMNDGRKGPVWITVPVDVQNMEIQ